MERCVGIEYYVSYWCELHMDMKMSQESRHEGAIYHACAISLFEQYNGNSIKDFSLALLKSLRVTLDLREGGEREVVRFFSKRVSCSCLKAKYSLVKKSQPIRMGECSKCKRSKQRSSLMLCGYCKVTQYCCKECQAADWPNHKGLCMHTQKLVAECN